MFPNKLKRSNEPFAVESFLILMLVYFWELREEVIKLASRFQAQLIFQTTVEFCC